MGSTFPVGQTTVECKATDAAGNTGTASFTVIVNAPPPAKEPIQTVLTLNTIRNVLWDKDVTEQVN
jgi:hypothetical protein